MQLHSLSLRGEHVVTLNMRIKGIPLLEKKFAIMSCLEGAKTITV